MGQFFLCSYGISGKVNKFFTPKTANVHMWISFLSSTPDMIFFDKKNFANEKS